jgi:putative hydrolase of the HAD superfamily
MTRPPVTHVLLDFFGTLVRYSPSRTAQGYRQSHALARELGVRADYPGFLGAWAAEWARLDERSAAGYREFSMAEGAAAGLARHYRLAVVTNTHQAGLVPAHLAAMGIDCHLAAVVTSVEVGWRKPHPASYAAALRQLGADPAAAAFAGDTYDADYAGPLAAGMTAFLIDPGARHDIPAGHRLGSLADLPARLRDAVRA